MEAMATSSEQRSGCSCSWSLVGCKLDQIGTFAEPSSRQFDFNLRRDSLSPIDVDQPETLPPKNLSFDAKEGGREPK